MEQATHTHWRTVESLSQADLFGVLLGNANLWQVDLSFSNLKGTGLGGYKTSARFDSANLRDATLSGGDCANLSFRNADMTGAYMYHSHFKYADFRGANLTKANMHNE